VLCIRRTLAEGRATGFVSRLGFAGAGGSHASAGTLVLGVFAGSTLWWLMLSGGVSLLRSKFDARRLEWVNRISGVIITGFGVAALSSLVGRGG
jgi:arginine exporter protein ArgO